VQKSLFEQQNFHCSKKRKLVNLLCCRSGGGLFYPFNFEVQLSDIDGLVDCPGFGQGIGKLYPSLNVAEMLNLVGHKKSFKMRSIDYGGASPIVALMEAKNLVETTNTDLGTYITCL